MSALQKLNEQVYTVHRPLKVLGMNLGTRATILRLPSEKLVIISPVPFDDGLAAEIEALGTVDTIIAPNLFHHLFFNAACERWPDARALVPPGLKKKTTIIERAEQLSESGAIDDEIFWHRLNGMPIVREHLFVYPGAKTLVITDLGFNFHDPPAMFFRLYLRMQGILNRFGMSVLFRTAIKDKKAFGASLAAILDYDFEAIALPHGRLIKEEGRTLFEETFRPYFPAA